MNQYFDDSLPKILYLDGPHAYLSNFHETPIHHPAQSELVFPSTEAYYQAMKTTDAAKWPQVMNLKPGQAKRWGKTLERRPDWFDGVNLLVMAHALSLKFTPGSWLGAKLAETGFCEIVETVHWYDSWWGFREDTQEGKNWLGILLMRQRWFLNSGEWVQPLDCPIDLTREFYPLKERQIESSTPPSLW